MLKLSLLGDIAIQIGDRVVAGLPSRAAEALLIYLICNPRPIAREKLAELLWADRTQTQALTNLRTILTPLRRELGDYLLVTRQTLAFNHELPCWLDAARFVDGLSAVGLPGLGSLDAATASHLQLLLDLYHGDFLEGFYLRDGRGFEEWATLQRERLRHLARQGLRLLAHYQLQAGDYAEGIPTAARWRQLDPYSEEACRVHMRLHTRLGEPHLALRSYQDLKKSLKTELGISPGTATTALFEQIQAVQFPPPLEIPALSVPFVGRESEIIEIERLLVAAGDLTAARLVTLSGPGGIGKTRLAVEAARSIAQKKPGRFMDGIFFVPLGFLKSAEYLPSHLAEHVHFTLQGSDSPENQVLAHLKIRESLLILDNFEHLIEDRNQAHTFLIKILKHAPAIRLLITSRERLNLYEEVILDLTGLAVPDDDAPQPEMFSAPRLFVESARRVKQGFAPNLAEWSCIARTCRLVDGVPLAIELAAGWVRHFSCAEIARQVQQNLDFLASEFHDLPKRQRSLRAVFEYSWGLLTPDEAATFERLSVFAGSFSAEAAQAVTGRRTLLSDLADQSLLQSQHGDRFEVHPLLRAYAAEKLRLDLGAFAEVSGEHAAFYLGFLFAQGSGESPEQRAAIRLELSNIRAAWEWAHQSRQFSQLERAAPILHSFFSIQSWFHEGIELFAAAIAQLGAGESPDPAAVGLRCELLARKARMHIHLGALDQARSDLQGALADLENASDAARRVNVLDSLAITYYYAGDYPQAITLAEESLRLSEEAGDSDGIGFALNFLGSCAKAQGDYDTTRSYFVRAAEMYLSLQDEIGAAMVYNNLGNLLQTTGDLEGAQAYYEQGGALFKAHEHLHGAATTLSNAGKLACKQGAYEQASSLLEESLLLKREIGDSRGAAVSLAGLGEVALATEDYPGARQYLLEALELAHAAGDTKLVLEIFVSFGELLARRGTRETASGLLHFTLDQPGVAEEARQHAERIVDQFDLGKKVSESSEQPIDFQVVTGVIAQLRSLGE